jgi:NitT/TauT family transport system permease protein
MRLIRPSFIGVLAALLIWQAVSMLKVISPVFFATPAEVVTEAITMLQSGGIVLDTISTLGRVLISIALATAVGLPLGLFLGYYSSAHRYLAVLLDFFRSIPPVVIYPLLLICIGPTDWSRICTAALGGMLVIILIVAQGLAQQDRTRQHFLRMRGCSLPLLLRDVVWFEALPHTFTALRTAASLAVIVIVVTEMLVGGEHGLGMRVQQVQISSDVPDLYVTVIVIGLVGVGLNKTLQLLEKRLVFWRG